MSASVGVREPRRPRKRCRSAGSRQDHDLLARHVGGGSHDDTRISCGHAGKGSGEFGLMALDGAPRSLRPGRNPTTLTRPSGVTSALRRLVPMHDAFSAPAASSASQMSLTSLAPLRPGSGRRTIRSASVSTLDQFEHQIARFADCWRCNAAMFGWIEAGPKLQPHAETGQHDPSPRKLSRQNLYCHVALELLIARPIDLAHAALRAKPNPTKPRSVPIGVKPIMAAKSLYAKFRESLLSRQSRAIRVWLQRDNQSRVQRLTTLSYFSDEPQARLEGRNGAEAAQPGLMLVHFRQAAPATLPTIFQTVCADLVQCVREPCALLFERNA